MGQKQVSLILKAMQAGNSVAHAAQQLSQLLEQAIPLHAHNQQYLHWCWSLICIQFLSGAIPCSVSIVLIAFPDVADGGWTVAPRRLLRSAKMSATYVCLQSSLWHRTCAVSGSGTMAGSRDSIHGGPGRYQNNALKAKPSASLPSVRLTGRDSKGSALPSTCAAAQYLHVCTCTCPCLFV